MKKKWLGLLTAAFALTAALGFAACDDKDSGKGDSGKGEKTQIEQIYDQYVIYAEAEGQDPLSYEQWLETIKGEDGVGIASVTVNEDGALVITFTDGTSQTVDMPADDTVTESLRYQKIAGKDEYRVMGMGTVSDLDIVIPATYRGLPVTEIGANAFEKEYYITSVTIGENVTTIGREAFYGCESLTSVYYTGDIAKWCAIDFVCESEYVGANPLEYAGNFYIKNTLVTDLVIPDNVLSIGYGAFDGYKGLTSVTIPDSVTTIGYYAFRNCENLESVYYTGNIAGWCGIAFGYWSNPASSAEELYIDGELVAGDLVIPDGVETIGAYAFSDCAGLRSVTIGESVKTIGDGAFSGCRRLVEVYNKSSLEITAGSRENGFVGYYALNVYTPTSGASKISTDTNGYIIYTDGDDKILIGYSGSETALTLPSGITEINMRSMKTIA